MIELYVIDLVLCLGLESLVDQIVFSIGDPQLLIIKDGSEARIAHKSAITLVLVLEERLDQESSVSDVRADSLHACVQLGFFFGRERALGIQDRRRLESRQGGLRVLLQVLQGEDVFYVLIEIEISDFDWVYWIPIVILQFLVFFSGQLKLLCVESCSELGGFNGSFSQRVVILQEFSQPDSISHDLILDFPHQAID